MGALESGKSLAEQILAKLPEHMRGSVQAALIEAPEAKDALTLLGESALARSDYSRQSDELKKQTDAITEQAKAIEADKAKLAADFENLNTWYSKTKGQLEEYSTIKPEYDRLKAGKQADPNPNPNPNPAAEPPLGFKSREDFDKYLAERDLARDEGYARVLSLTAKLSAQHLHQFNEVLDTDALIEHARTHKVPLYDPRAETDAYRALHGTQLEERAKAEEDKRIEKLVADRLAEARKNQSLPYPTGGVEPAAIDQLPTTESGEAPADPVAAAAARYAELAANAGSR